MKNSLAFFKLVLPSTGPLSKLRREVCGILGVNCRPKLPTFSLYITCFGQIIGFHKNSSCSPFLLTQNYQHLTSVPPPPTPVPLTL